MDKVWVVAKREYLERVRSRWFVVMTLLVPVLITATFLVPAWVAAKAASGSAARNIVILDATSTGLGQRVADILVRDSSAAAVSRRAAAAPEPGPQVRVVSQAQLPAAEDSATRQVMKPNSIVGYLVLDDSTLSARRIRYAGRNASSIVDMDRVRSAVRQAFTSVVLQRECVKPETISLISSLSLNMSQTRIDERGKGGNAQAAIFLGIGIGVLLLMSIVFHGQNVLRGVL